MRWAGQVARVGDRRRSYRILAGKIQEKIEVGVDGKIILKWTFKGWDEVVRTALICLVASYCECGGETLNSIKWWNLFTS